MKKSLIVTVTAAALLAVSCGKGGGAKKSWDKDAKQFMMDWFGEVLPYVAFDKDTFGFYSDVDIEDGIAFGEFEFSDDNEKDLMSGYGSALVKAGWTELTDDDLVRSRGEEVDPEGEDPEEPEDTSKYYSKVTASGAEVIIECDYMVPGEDDEWNAGNDIYGQFYWEMPRVESYTFTEANALFKDNGIKLTLPEFELAKEEPEEEPEEDPEGLAILRDGEDPEDPEEPEEEPAGVAVEIVRDINAITYNLYFGTLADLTAYGEAMVEAGWTAEIDEDYGDYYLNYGETLARASLIENVYYGYISFTFYVLSTEFSFADVVSAYADEGITVKIPDFKGEGFTYSFSAAGGVAFSNITSTELATWVSALSFNGWSLAQDSYGDYSGRFGRTRATIRISDYSAYGFFAVYFDLSEEAVWPAEEIAADFAAQEEPVTDTLPEFEGVALAYRYYAAGATHQLTIEVGAGYEADAITSYQATLVAAGFTDNGTDDFGDKHFLSPNGDFDVSIWDGNDASTPNPGFVYVDIAFPRKPGYITRELQKVVDNRHYSSEVTLPDFSSLEQYFYYEQPGTTAYRFYLSGDHVQDVLALMADSFDIPETPSASYGYECYYKTNDNVEIDVMLYNNAYTMITLYTYAE